MWLVFFALLISTDVSVSQSTRNSIHTLAPKDTKLWNVHMEFANSATCSGLPSLFLATVNQFDLTCSPAVNGQCHCNVDGCTSESCSSRFPSVPSGLIGYSEFRSSVCGMADIVTVNAWRPGCFMNTASFSSTSTACLPDGTFVINGSCTGVASSAKIPHQCTPQNAASYYLSNCPVLLGSVGAALAAHVVVLVATLLM
jgi:hypothetical protein